jgi:hypothetical protein
MSFVDTDDDGSAQLPKDIQQEHDKANDLEGVQDQGGKHGGQAGMPKPPPLPGSAEAEQDEKALKNAIGRSWAEPGPG